ncbi:DNA polymerase zeta catalytic subunit [Ischnura elegans]|uniref:DNA polymerase zeta catalytic subunit n=1 Tax=Ischnura elegans TaxID=197161 RepID=UPI001ED89EA0|nr:DNA polymerase zeta catalytic subunit [Ischnura elegans]
MVSVRIVTADHYMTAPSPNLDVFYSDFRGSEVKQVPVIRIFGSDSKGKKVCLHVHGVFPYIYVPYDGFEPQERKAYRLASGLDKALNVSLGKSNATTQHVYKISLVSGRPFYGYHEKEHQFYKIYLYNPIMVKRTADLLQSGAVLGKSFQPHEAHLSFILQFFIDFNLYGMNLINLSKVFYRRPQNVTEIELHPPCKSSSTITSSGNIEVEQSKSIPEELYLPESIPRISSCEIEIDTLATSISNRSGVGDGVTVIPGLAAIWEEERERLRMKGLSSQLSLPASETRDDPFYTKSEVFYQEKLLNQLHAFQDTLSSPRESISLTQLSLDTSGYPSETPENISLQDATLVEVHLPASANETLNRTKPPSIPDLPSEEDIQNNISQNSVFLDTQDEILMNEWGDMLEENLEDSILNPLTPVLNDVEPNVPQEELVEDIEDNHLLEMSQVFCLEEKIRDEDEMDTRLHEGSDVEESSFSAKGFDSKTLQGTPGRNSFESSHDKRDDHSDNGNKSDDICEWEELWDDDENEDFDVEPIAQLDGADDTMLMKPKAGKPSTTHRRRLGLRGRTNLSLQGVDLNSGQMPASGPSSSNTKSIEIKSSEHLPSSPVISPKSASKSGKFDVTPLRSTFKVDEGFRPLISVAKHRRINELKRQSRISLSVAKDKPKKSHLPDSGVITRSTIPRKLGLSRSSVAGNSKAIQNQVKNETVCKKNLNSATAHSPVPAMSKRCTIRLELLNEVLLDDICQKHGVILSSHSAKLFNEAFNVSEDVSGSSFPKGSHHESQLVEETPSSIKNDILLQKKKDLRRQSGFIVDEAFRDDSAQRVTDANQYSVKDRSLLTLNTPSSPKKRHMRKPPSSESKLGSPKGKGDRLSSSKMCYRPLTVKIQKSPVKSRGNLNFSPNSVPCTSPVAISCVPLSAIELSDDENTATPEILMESGKNANTVSLEKGIVSDNVTMATSVLPTTSKGISDNVSLNSSSGGGDQNIVRAVISETSEEIDGSIRLRGSHLCDKEPSVSIESSKYPEKDDYQLITKNTLEDGSENLADLESSVDCEKTSNNSRCDDLSLDGGNETYQTSEGDDDPNVIKMSSSPDVLSMSFQEDNDESFPNSGSSSHKVKKHMRAKQHLNFSGESSKDADVSDLEYFELSSSGSSDDQVAASTKNSGSESSLEDGDLGIVSFCAEDVLDCTFVSPTFDCKFLRESQRMNLSQAFVSKHKGSEEARTAVTPELPSSPDRASVDERQLSFTGTVTSSDESIVDMEKLCKIDHPTWFIDDYEDNGFEFAPVLKAPSREEVEDFKFNVEPKGLPFCSDPNDIPAKPMEVGELVLRLHSNRPSELPQFENCLGCPGLEDHRKLTLENNFGEVGDVENVQLEKISKSALLPEGGAREVIIKPCQDPPNYRDVMKWLDEKNCGLALKRVDDNIHNESKRKVRLGMGCSLDDDDDNDDSELVSLSPCSSLGSQRLDDPCLSKRSLSYQSTPCSSLKSIKHSDKLASPFEHSIGFSPIQEQNEEEDLIMCTPPPPPTAEVSSINKPKLRSGMNSFSRRRLVKDSKSCRGEIEEEFSPLKTTESNKDESSGSRNFRLSGEMKLDLQKGIMQRNSHHIVGLGGSGHSSCQIDGMSPNNTYGFQNSPNNFQEAKAIQQPQFITVMTMEIQVSTRGHLRPDPEHDAIQAIFYSVVEDGARQIEANEHCETGIIMVESSSCKKSKLIGSCDISLEAVQVVTDESLLFEALGKLVTKWDPDIFAGYEVEMLSWGYVIERGNHLGMDVKSLLSRIFTINPAGSTFKEKTSEPFEMDSRRIKDTEDYDPIQLPGRIVLNVWRIMRSEAALMSYTFENVMYHLLHERIPSHSYKSLNDWWEHRTNLYRWITIEYWIVRVKGVMRLLVQLDIVGRTSELARLFGIQFYEVFSRGSQFRVESMMLRLAKPLNYVCVSPSSKQRASMKAPEQLPLIMEPESRFYADPVIVLDFQSLYPSMIIAYNYCFSTCLGRVKHLGQLGPFEFGCTNLMVPPKTIAKLLNQKGDTGGNPSYLRSKISFSPCGVAFVGKEVRHGVLPKMLSEILETRLMVKKALKENKGNRVVERVLNSRQLGLKLIANVTYGYTAANFSGRMPCIEVGDSVVSKGRETLERAIAMVHDKWGSKGVKVVYGDTDSLFVLAKGFTKTEAFNLGAEIAELVTESNPKPVKLKLEKVFQPCLLQTKKRYVGYAYETPDQENPIFDAKGIETVRRDGCPAAAKILEKSLRLLFDTRDVSLVKLHVQRQLGKLLSGRLSLQELTFAREYRGASGYRPGACVPALQLARRWLSADRRAEPRSGERVPYVIVNGPPGLPLFQLVRSPNELLNLGTDACSSNSTVHCQLQVNAHYYITKVLVPPLQRCFSLIGVDVEPWYADMPRKHRSLLQPSATSFGINGNVDSKKADGMKASNPVMPGSKRSTISEYFVTSDCLSCGVQLDVKNRASLCKACVYNSQSTLLNLIGRCNSWERTYSSLSKLCQSCCQRMERIECTSLDCPILYRRHQAFAELEQAHTLRNVLEQLA